MTLLADIKTALRISSDAYDSEVETLVSAALYDMERAGVSPTLLGEDPDNPLVRRAVMTYCKANFGYDNDEAPRFDDSYNRVVIDLLNSPANIADRDWGVTR